MNFRASMPMVAAICLYSQSALAETYLMDCGSVFKLEVGFFSSSISESGGIDGWRPWCDSGTLEFEDEAVTCDNSGVFVLDTAGARVLFESECMSASFDGVPTPKNASKDERILDFSLFESDKNKTPEGNLSVNGKSVSKPDNPVGVNLCENVVEAKRHLPWTKTVTEVIRLDFQLGKRYDKWNLESVVNSAGEQMTTFLPNMRSRTVNCTRVIG